MKSIFMIYYKPYNGFYCSHTGKERIERCYFSSADGGITFSTAKAATIRMNSILRSTHDVYTEDELEVWEFKGGAL